VMALFSRRRTEI